MLINITGKSHTGRTRNAVKHLKADGVAVCFTTSGDVVDRVRESFKTSKERFDILKNLAVIKGSNDLMIKMLKATIDNSNFDTLIFDDLGKFSKQESNEIKEMISIASVAFPKRDFIVVEHQLIKGL